MEKVHTYKKDCATHAYAQIIRFTYVHSYIVLAEIWFVHIHIHTYYWPSLVDSAPQKPEDSQIMSCFWSSYVAFRNFVFLMVLG